MKKLASYTLAAVAVLSLAFAPAISLGQTATSSIQAQLDAIAKLQQQILDLQKQIAPLMAQQQTNIGSLLSILKQGSRGENVKTLQALLAADPSLYPEGLITGFFGPATARAVKRFQQKHGLEQVGNVGPKTLAKLLKMLDDNPLGSEDSDDESEGKRPCAIVPPGHLIAPGWLKKKDGQRPIVPLCQILPKGIAKKLATSTPDITALIISGISVSGIASTSATIKWSLSELANTSVFYATTTPVSFSASSASGSSATTTQSVGLSGLTASTTYYFLIKATDSAGNVGSSTQQSFMTL